VRVIYFGDPPPEETVETPSLLYRALQNPAITDLQVIYRAGYKTVPDKRLSGVSYRPIQAAWHFLPYRYYIQSSTNLFLPEANLWRAYRLVRDFQPQAIVSVAHGYFCLTAQRLAALLGVSFHLFCHDDWRQYHGVHPALNGFVAKRFGHMYRAAVGRYCVSEYMEREYRQCYGVGGDVMLPCRPFELPVHTEPPPMRDPKGLRIAFVGTLWCVTLLEQLARLMQSIGGQLLIYSDPEQAAVVELCARYSAIRAMGFVPVNELVPHLRTSADVLFVPMDFSRSKDQNYRFAFPSKLAVYTAAALPLWIVGPAECSAVRWARRYNAAKVTDSLDENHWRDALAWLSDGAHRQWLARRAADVGQMFSADAAQALFADRIRRPLCDGKSRSRRSRDQKR
jgi:Glycosyltransferase Family 4